MKARTKAMIAMGALVSGMLVLPWAAIELADGLATTGLWFFAFFAVNPLLVIGLSVMAGTDIRRLWWIPVAIAALFPVLFGIAIRDLVWELYVYSAIYLPIGVLSMLGTHFAVRFFRTNRR